MSAEERAKTKWDVETTSGYRRGAFYTQASDKQGHSSKITVRFPVNIAAEISNIVTSGKIPEYRNPMDFIRDAVIHQLHYVQPMIDDPESHRRVSMHLIHAEAMRKKQERLEFEEMMAAIVEEIEHLTQLGDSNRTRKYIAGLLDKAEEAIPDEFRPQFEADLRLRLKIVGG